MLLIWKGLDIIPFRLIPNYGDMQHMPTNLDLNYAPERYLIADFCVRLLRYFRSSKALPKLSTGFTAIT